MDAFALLAHTVATGASDLHIRVGLPPMVRLHGELLAVGEVPLDDSDTQKMVDQVCSLQQRERLAEEREVDFAIETDDSRFRANVFMERRGYGGVFRVIPTKIKSVEDLGVPQAIIDLCRREKGLVVVTGPTGSGKSTTLAAMIDLINSERNGHILTIEDPIEFVHQPKRCVVTQREVGSHTNSFANALRASLREDPDVILVGEMRDLETISLAITAAETGHLVFGTLHTMSAPKTIDRIVDAFPADRQEQIRVMLSESLEGVISQALLPTKDGNGRVAAHEILVVLPSIRNIIREAKTHQVQSIMQTGMKHGMVTMDVALERLVQQGLIDADVARRRLSAGGADDGQ
ncbi:MAG TPA: type IV pilus twitching motility protein PilT [Actinomycetota bacterium]|nr:type IV pilus twitching motility protein PilT [Actinomycetota bacterium]